MIQGVESPSPQLARSMHLLGGRRVTLRDLLDARLLQPGAALRFVRTRVGVRHDAQVTDTGRIKLLPDGQEFRSPSQAARVAAGVRAVDGWRAWMVVESGRPLDAFRQELLDRAVQQAAKLADSEAKEAIDRRIYERLRQARSHAEANEPDEIAVRQLLALWGAKGRGDQISRIEADLANHGLVTSPSFRKVTLDATVLLVTAPDEPEGPAGEVLAEEIASADADELDASAVGLTVGNLPSALGGVVSVPPNATFELAITAMLLNDYSQLAVISGTRALRGAVTWRSIARTRHANPNAQFSDAIEQNVHDVRYDKELVDVLPLLQQSGFVFVRDVKNTVAGIVTTADVVSAYGEMAMPFFQIGEVDRSLRRLIANTFELDEVAELCGRPLRSFTEMSMGDYERVLENAHIWTKLGWPLDRHTFIRRLVEVRHIRNDVMHFNPDPLPSDAVEKLRRLNGLLRLYSE